MKQVMIIGAVVWGVVQPASAWFQDGQVLCDADADGQLSEGDTPLVGVRVFADATTMTSTHSTMTVENGYYNIDLMDVPASYVTWLDDTTLPADAIVLVPAEDPVEYSLTDTSFGATIYWLVDSAECRDTPPPPPEPTVGCWMTGGGFLRAGRGERETFGGNVFPSCDPAPGGGGQWNHVSQTESLHLIGTSILSVSCGNVDGIPEGSQSPETPFNFIEFEGEGILQGIAGNDVGPILVTFFGRVEDRGEPGSSDRYFLQVWDAGANTVLLVDDDGEPAEISGGNLQLHATSCEAPKGFDLDRGSERAVTGESASAEGCNAVGASPASAMGLSALIGLMLVWRQRRV